MCVVSSKPFCGSLVPEHNGDSCPNNSATGTPFINASPDGVNLASLKSCSSIFHKTAIWNIYCLTRLLSAHTLALRERKKTRRTKFRQKSRRLLDKDSFGYGR